MRNFWVWIPLTVCWWCLEALCVPLSSRGCWNKELCPRRWCHNRLQFVPHLGSARVGSASPQNPQSAQWDWLRMGHNYPAPLGKNRELYCMKHKDTWKIWSLVLFLSVSVCTCVSHITEAHSRDAIPMSPTVVWTGLRDVDPIQSKRWSISVHTALLEPTEPGFTGKWGDRD